MKKYIQIYIFKNIFKNIFKYIQKYIQMKTREDKQKQNKKKVLLNPNTGMVTLNTTGVHTWINRYYQND